MLKQLGEKEKVSDYDRMLNNTNTTLSFGSKKNIPCKVICSGTFRKRNNQNDIDFKIEIPKTEMINKLSIESNNEDTFGFDYRFLLHSFNNKGDLFKLHIEN